MDGSAVAQIIPLILIVAIFWLLIVRPARKKQKAMTQLRSSIEVGDTVLLGSGMYGQVRSVIDDGVRLEIAPEVVVRVHRDAIVSVEDRVAAVSDTDADSDAGTGSGPAVSNDPDR
ncbi:MAG TPA: preprotein translocase subunit YajC [Nocardioidaceae bacterium]|nr:preprotein translocase subunit YajC [Nocardioidaceae bacterium]